MSTFEDQSKLFNKLTPSKNTNEKVLDKSLEHN